MNFRDNPDALFASDPDYCDEGAPLRTAAQPGDDPLDDDALAFFSVATFDNE